MIPSLRQQYNQHFTKGKYQAYLNDLENIYPGHLDFRIAETPVFVPKDFVQKMLSACESIIDRVNSPDYFRQSDKAIPPDLHVPGAEHQPQFIAFDFGVCLDGKGGLAPQLIELQGFPTLFTSQVFQPQIHHKHFPWPEGFR